MAGGAEQRGPLSGTSTDLSWRRARRMMHNTIGPGIPQNHTATGPIQGDVHAPFLDRAKVEHSSIENSACGVELMHMIKKRQLVVEEENEGRTAAEQFYG